MNSIGTHRRQQQHRERGLDRARVDASALEPVAERAIADLVVVLQER